MCVKNGVVSVAGTSFVGEAGSYLCKEWCSQWGWHLFVYISLFHCFVYTFLTCV